MCADADPAVQEYLERRERDEEIKRRAGQIHPDETYEDYEERMREKAFQRAADDWQYEQYEDDEPESEAEGEPEGEAERQKQAAEQIAFRVRLKALVESASPPRDGWPVTPDSSRTPS